MESGLGSLELAYRPKESKLCGVQCWQSILGSQDFGVMTWRILTWSIESGLGGVRTWGTVVRTWDSGVRTRGHTWSLDLEYVVQTWESSLGSPYWESRLWSRDLSVHCIVWTWSIESGLESSDLGFWSLK